MLWLWEKYCIVKTTSFQGARKQCITKNKSTSSNRGKISFCKDYQRRGTWLVVSHRETSLFALHSNYLLLFIHCFEELHMTLSKFILVCVFAGFDVPFRCNQLFRGGLFFKCCSTMAMSQSRICWCSRTMAISQSSKHGAEQYTGYLEIIFYGHHLDRAVPRVSEAIYCLTPSLQSRNTGKALYRLGHCENYFFVVNKKLFPDQSVSKS